MYDDWSKSVPMDGRTALLVSVKKGDLELDSLPQRFSRLGDVIEQKVAKNGTPVGSFFYRIGYGLKPCERSEEFATSCETSSDD